MTRVCGRDFKVLFGEHTGRDGRARSVCCMPTLRWVAAPSKSTYRSSPSTYLTPLGDDLTR